MHKAIILINIIAQMLFFKHLNATDFNKDSIVNQVKIYSTENPELAAVYCHKIFTQFKNNPNDTLAFSYHIAMSDYKKGIGLTNDALAHADTALNIANSMQNYSWSISAMLAKSSILTTSGNYSEAFKVIEKAKTLSLRTKKPENIIQCYLNYGDIYKELGRSKEAIEKKNEATALAKKYNTKLAESYKSLGSTQFYFGLYQDALKSYYEGLIAAEHLLDTSQIISITKNIGLIYRELGDFDKALTQLNDAMLLAQKTNKISEIAEILNIIGGVYIKFSRPKQALSYYNQSLALREKLNLKQSCIKTLSNLARTYLKLRQNDYAIKALQRAINLSKEVGDPITEANTQTDMGNTFLQLGNYAQALKQYLIALKIRQSYGKAEDIAKSMINIALVYRNLGLTQNALKYALDAKKTLENLEVKPDLKIYVFRNLGNIYLDKKDYAQAIAAYQKALELSEKKGDDILLTSILKNIAQAYLDWGNIRKARNTASQAAKIAIRNNQNQVLADIYNTLGNVEKKAKNYDLAIRHFTNAAQKYKSSANPTGEALCYRKIGEIYTIKKDFELAYNFINTSISTGWKIKNPYLVAYGFKSLYELEYKKENYKKALEYYQKHISIKDSIENAKHNESNLEAHINLELDKTKNEIKLIEAEVESLRTKVQLDKERIKKQKAQRNFLITIVLLLLFIAATTVFFYIQKKKLSQFQQEKYDELARINNELNRYRKELEQTIKTKDKLFSIIAHDLRSPFTGLLGFSEILSQKADELSIEEVKDYSHNIYLSASNILMLTENLLHWAKSQSGRIKLSPTEVDIQNLINDAIAVASIAAKEKNIQIQHSIKEPYKLVADYDTLLTVIRNLLSNAVKFTPSGGKVSVEVLKEMNSLKIKISDTGVGIEPENLNKLFKLDGYTTKGTNSESGTGLGLIICKEFTEANGGKIEVASTIGKGTTFTITLPLKND